MITYQFQILRYLPDRVSGEFVNLGVVVYEENTYKIASTFTDRIARVSSFFPGVNVRSIHRVVRFLQSEFNKKSVKLIKEIAYEKYSSLDEITRTILQKDDSALVFSEVKRGRDISLEAALSELFERLVSHYFDEEEQEVRSDRELWQQVYKRYFDEVRLTEKFKPHRVKTKLDILKFDHAIKNGVWNCFETINFNLTRPENVKSKVYKWDGRIRELRTSSETLNLYLFVEYPQKHPELKNFIDEKLNNIKFDDSKVEIVPQEQVLQLALDLKEEVNSHD